MYGHNTYRIAILLSLCVVLALSMLLAVGGHAEELQSGPYTGINADIVSQTYAIERCCGTPGTQRSPQLDFRVELTTTSVLRIKYDVPAIHCSDIRLHILVDERDVHVTEFIGPISGIMTTGTLDLGPVVSGKHSLTLSPEGRVGGCNTGWFYNWFGTLVVSTDGSIITGRVTDASGVGIPGVTVWAGFPRNTTTDANGNYTFTGLAAGTYTIRPEKDPYVFSPESRAVTVPPSATSVNFTGQVPIVHVKLLYVPLNWQNTQAAFDAEADLQSSIFFDQVPLSACPEKYRVEKLSVAAQNFIGFTCSGDAIGSIREFLRQQGIKAEDYTAIIGLAETSPCPPTGGQSNGTNTVWVTAEYDIVTAHELGHFWGLSDQYCSDRDGMSTDDRCNDGDIQGDDAQTGDVNWLDSSLPCDCPPDWSADSTGAQCCNFITTCDKSGGCYFKGVFIAGYNQSYLRRCDSEDYGELGAVHVNYGACCLGNKTAGGGRTIMSFANIPGPRAFDIHDLAHLTTRPELNCDVVTASQTTAGGLPSYVRQLILDVNLLVHQNDSVQDKGVHVTWGRPTSDSVLQGLDGNYAIAVFDASGAQVWSQAFPLYFDYTGPVVVGEDYSEITYDSMDVAFRIPHACGMSELRLYHNGRIIYSKPLPTVCPIYLPLVFRNN